MRFSNRVHGHLGGQCAHLRMNRSDFRGSGGNQGCLAEPADEQFQGLIALFQIFRLYLGGIRVLIAGSQSEASVPWAASLASSFRA